jgi:hypothetical protein
MRKAVLEDDQRDVGVPMLLHTAASLGQDVDPGRFSTAGYLHQAALGRRLLETGDLDGEQTGARLLSLNFHEIPLACRDEAAERVRRVATLGKPYDPDEDVEDLRVMVAFYDADRETGLFADRLCRELGVRAYFFPVDATTLETGPRLADDDLATIAEHHELCFHTATHRSAREITPANQEREVVAPIERMARAAGRPPRLAAWRGGARFDSGTLGDRMLRDLGVRHLVSNWSIERID